MNKTAILIVPLLAVACSSTPPAAPPAAPTAPAAPMSMAPVVAQPAPAAAPAASELNDPNGPLAKRSIHFPYDAFTVDQKYLPTLQAHGTYLSRHAGTKVVIEGNADERGSREYNLALGQKRSEAVKKALILGGAAEAQLEAISYGEERPRIVCHEERCWQENRRADIVYPAGAK